ncbi:MAG: hypothetical protein O2960_10405 [Verrucomicrobia bacterium]|nr:hypothetical protein [Verrucomicrobiota bacterium]
MKQNPFATFLVVLLFLGALATTGLSYSYIQKIRELRDLQNQTSVINRNRTMFQNLANDAIAYGQQNPKIFPLLEVVGIRVEEGQIRSSSTAN